MKKMIAKKNQVANFTNSFAENAQLGFNTAGQFKILLAIVGQIDSKQTDRPMTGILSLEQIVKLTKEDGYKNSGSVKVRVQERIDAMMKRNTVTLASDIKGLKKYKVFIDKIDPKEIDGTLFYEWRIHKDMRPYVTGLIRDFVQVALPKSMKSAHAIRFLILALAYHNQHKKHALNKITRLELSIKELKRILNIEGQYPRFGNLRIRVIEPIIADINKSGFLFIQHYNFIRTGRKITGIEFCFQDAKFTDITDLQKKKQIVPSDKKADDTRAKEAEILKLTKAELTAFEFLEKRLVYGAIALKQIVKKMPSSECIGYEDLYIKNAWSAFENKTKIQNASAETKAKLFVTWWKKGAFHSSENKNFTNTLEQTIAQKKQQSAEVRANREEAKNMNNAEFEKLQQQRKNKEKAEPEVKTNVISVSPSQNQPQKKGDFQGMGEILKKFAPQPEQEEKEYKITIEKTGGMLADFEKWKVENILEFSEIMTERAKYFDVSLFNPDIEQDKQKIVMNLVFDKYKMAYKK